MDTRQASIALPQTAHGGTPVKWRRQFSLYVGSFTFMYLLLAATGLDLMTAFSAVAACINNLGPGLAQVGAHYNGLADPAKWILCFAMLLGRLEIFTFR